MLTRLVVLFFSLSSIESFLKFFKVLWKTSHPSEDLFTITITYVSDPNELAIVLFFSLSSIGGGFRGSRVEPPGPWFGSNWFQTSIFGGLKI